MKNQRLRRTDPSQVVNFRDVGTWINLIANRPLLVENKLYRGGVVRYIRSLKVIECPRTIFNLQRSPDPEFPGVLNFHFPISRDYEKYETNTPEVREWLRNVIRTVESGIDYPLYVHCYSGKDSTAVIVAALLLILGVETRSIVQEYLLSDGKVNEKCITVAIEGMGDVNRYFSGIDLGRVRQELRGER